MMRLVHVIPITRGVGKDTLTYFTAKEVSPGTLVTVPLRKKLVPALVVSAEDAALSKTELKHAGYELKKIVGVKKGALFLPQFIDAAKNIAEYFVSSPGAVIEALSPNAIIQELSSITTSAGLLLRKKPQPQALTKLPPEKLLFQADEEERLAAYKSIIREEFARGHSLFFCLPTIQDIEYFAPHLRRGIEEFSYVFYAGLSGKKILAGWKAALKEPHPILLIGTGSFLSLPRQDIKTIVLERENAAGFRRKSRPHIDIRTATEFIAAKFGARLIWGDTLLRSETLVRKERGEFLEFRPLKFRALSEARQELIDMHEEKDEAGKETFRLFSKKLLELAEKTRDTNGHLFLFSSRRGLYPLVVCSDCSEVVSCARCRAPLVLHSGTLPKKQDKTLNFTSPGKIKNIFICHKCGVKVESSDRCKACGSWRFALLGMGVERTALALEKLLKGATIFRLDKDTAPTRKKALALRDAFYATPGSILVGTEMAVSYIDEKIPAVGVVSLDSLFAIPDYRASERVFGLLLRLRSRAIKRFLVQTRMRDKSLFEYAFRGNLLDFYRDEVAARKQFWYPPFAILVKVSLSGTKPGVSREMEELKEILADYKPLLYPAYAQAAKGKYTAHALVRLKSGAWPEQALLEKLRALPPAFQIEVNPESIL